MKNYLDNPAWLSGIFWSANDNPPVSGGDGRYLIIWKESRIRAQGILPEL